MISHFTIVMKPFLAMDVKMLRIWLFRARSK